MSDKANIGFLSMDRANCTWLYVHSAGSMLPEIAMDAVKAAEPRWGDPSYATRMALTATIGTIPLTQDTGSGVDVQPGENEHPAIIIDWRDRLLYVITAEQADSWHNLETAAQKARVLDSGIAIGFQSLTRDRIAQMMERKGDRWLAVSAAEQRDVLAAAAEASAS